MLAVKQAGKRASDRVRRRGENLQASHEIAYRQVDDMKMYERQVLLTRCSYNAIAWQISDDRTRARRWSAKDDYDYDDYDH